MAKKILGIILLCLCIPMNVSATKSYETLQEENAELEDEVFVLQKRIEDLEKGIFLDKIVFGGIFVIYIYNQCKKAKDNQYGESEIHS